MHISSINQQKLQKINFVIQNFRNFPDVSERIRTHPDASERIRVHPSASEHVPAGPSKSENLEKRAKTSKNLRKTCENSRKFSPIACFFMFLFLEVRLFEVVLMVFLKLQTGKIRVKFGRADLSIGANGATACALEVKGGATSVFCLVSLCFLLIVNEQV